MQEFNLGFLLLPDSKNNKEITHNTTEDCFYRSNHKSDPQTLTSRDHMKK
jgi:hypothetical protein